MGKWTIWPSGILAPTGYGGSSAVWFMRKLLETDSLLSRQHWSLNFPLCPMWESGLRGGWWQGGEEGGSPVTPSLLEVTLFAHVKQGLSETEEDRVRWKYTFKGSSAIG